MVIKRNKKTDLISGRAILWDCSLDGNNIKFLDRIYGDDITMAQFKHYAIEKQYAYKKFQSAGSHYIKYNDEELINKFILELMDRGYNNDIIEKWVNNIKKLK